MVSVSTASSVGLVSVAFLAFSSLARSFAMCLRMSSSDMPGLNHGCDSTDHSDLVDVCACVLSGALVCVDALVVFRLVRRLAMLVMQECLVIHVSFANVGLYIHAFTR